MQALAQSTVKNIEISAKIIRANGDVEDLGVIAEHKGNIFLRTFKKLFKTNK